MQFTLHIHGIGGTAQEAVDDMQLGPDGTVTGHLLFTISDQEPIR